MTQGAVCGRDVLTSRTSLRVMVKSSARRSGPDFDEHRVAFCGGGVDVIAGVVVRHLYRFSAERSFGRQGSIDGAALPPPSPLA